MDEKTFYANAALYAMQGIQEMGGKIGIVAEVLPEELAKKAFDIADHMLKEYKLRISKI